MYNKIKNFIIPSSAQFTEFLRDYLKTNDLPNGLSNADAVFELDFKELFKQHYYMREIGFDSEELFKQKLQTLVNINIPYYVTKASKLKTLFNEIFANGYSITQTNDLSRADTETIARDNTLTNNLTNTDVQGEDTTEKGYRTPLGDTNDTLDASALSDGKKTNKTLNDTQHSTGTVTTDEDITNAKSSRDTGTITTVFSKNPKFNSLDAIHTMQEEFKNIVFECLESFDNLFMQVF